MKEIDTAPTRPSLDRVVVIGSSCAGKSTFAVALGKQLMQPSFDLDTLFWGPDWMAKPVDRFRALVAQAAAGERWIAAGNYSDARDLLWSRATAVVWLDYAFPVVFWRSLRRTFRRIVTREELWHGNRESIRRSFFSRESILLWVVTTFRRRRRQFAALRDSGKFPHVAWLELRRPADADRYLRSLDNRR
jgi:adenylate kinase family enzyme